MRSSTAFRIAAVVLAATALACAGPPTPSPLSGEPVCADFEVGAAKTKMRGGLRLPVALTLLDGDKPVFRTTILGLRGAQEPPTRILLRDDDAEYKVEWAQCENERAPRPAIEAPMPKSKSTAAAPTREPPAEYECGKAVVYKTDKLVTKKGDLTTHALTFPAPPKTECWTSEAPPAAAAPDAGAPPETSAAPVESAAPAASASAPAASASASSSAPSASAATSTAPKAAASGSAKASK